MPTFPSKPHAPSPSASRVQQVLRSLRQRPFLLFGMPFLSLMVVSSFALQNLTKTRYDYQSSKTSTMTMEEGLGMSKDRKRVDIREEYFVSPSFWTSQDGADGLEETQQPRTDTVGIGFEAEQRIHT